MKTNKMQIKKLAKILMLIMLPIGAFSQTNTNYGTDALLNVTTGTGNSAFGNNALKNISTGSNSTAFGMEALMNSNANNNTAFGKWALKSTTTGYNNVAVGFGALQSNTTGKDNHAFGRNALFANTSGIGNLAFSTDALKNNKDGNHNNAIGYQALLNNTTGSGNIAIGHATLSANISGTNNIAIGVNSLSRNETGSGNIVFGDGAAYNNKAGSNNIFLGNYTAGNSETGSSNIFLGNNISIPDVSNSIAIGNDGNGQPRIFVNDQGNVGIGLPYPNSTNPTAKLHINGGVRIENLPTQMALGFPLNIYPLGIDDNGNLTYANPPQGGGAGESLWTVRTSTHSNSSTVNFVSLLDSYYNYPVVLGTTSVSGINSIPTSGFKLIVEDGILTEKVKVALKNSSDWSDYVFDNNYKLKSLNEVETFVKQNKHLPNVPSAQELVDGGGIDMNIMFAKQMEKIEELTLYLIEQNKLIKELEEKVKKLSDK